jgi:arylsulfatase A-like enzyme
LRLKIASSLLALLAAFALPTLAEAATRMNVLVVMTDDQRFDKLALMPNLTKLANQGVRFTNAYQTTPLCGPARASMFSGGYAAKNTGVLENTLPNGGIQLFDDANNFGRVMQQAGYQTYFVGKWVNEHGALGNYVPPGWTHFRGRLSNVLKDDWSNDINYVVGSSTWSSTKGTRATLSGQYITYYERDRILDLIDRAATDRPFLLFWSPAAPHPSAVPAPGDESAYSNFVYSGRGFGETDLSDKPAWLRYGNWPEMDQEFIRNQLRSVLSVDRSLGAIVERLRTRGLLDRTVIVFTSDNGYQWGEHGISSKNYAYEESALAPLVVVSPGTSPRTDHHLVAVNLDVPQTLYETAGVSARSDGKSLMPLLRDPKVAWRNQLFLEGYSRGRYGQALWAALRRGQWKYVRYWTGEEELYNLVQDPYELESRHDDPSLATLKSSMASTTRNMMGLGIVPVRKMPGATKGKAFRYQLRTWGGVGPFRWKVQTGALPPGVGLNATNGVITGTPTAVGSYTFTLRVTDSSYATQAKRARTFVSGPVTIQVR